MKGIFVWWEDSSAGMVEWRYICMENGGQFLTTKLTIKMLMLFVSSSDMTLDVSYKCEI